MASEVEPCAPDFVPAELEARYGTEARKVVRRSVRRRPSQDLLETWLFLVVGLSICVDLVAVGFGLMYLTMVARGLFDIVVAAAVVVVVLWAGYLAARHAAGGPRRHAR